MGNNVWIIVGVVVVVALGIWFFMAADTAPPPATAPVGTEVPATDAPAADAPAADAPATGTEAPATGN